MVLRKNCNSGKENGKKGVQRAARVLAWILAASVLTGCGGTEQPTDGAQPRDGEDTVAAGTGAAGSEEQGAAAETVGAQEPGTVGSDDAKMQETVSTGAQEDGGEKRPATMADLLQESGNVPEVVEAPELPDTVLWFNATYACLTYTNGCDWRWVGGMEPTEENAEKAEYLLYSSWNVMDRKSGVEAVNRLLGGGHRAQCQECMDDLEKWGLMELDETRFAEELTKIVTGERTDIDLGESPGRYVVAYYMYHNGIGAEYIAAWDFCRVNQLYADFYLCGFMDYEEAMDASLENSLRLQKMYDSWEEMMDAYMMGYQFWQGDLEITENSPTKERRSYYEMLKNSDDSPYELDWNMELEKSW